ncbi:hypothetical protein D9M72_503130 [compost metagenome]
MIERMGAVAGDKVRQAHADEAAVQARGEGAQYLQRRFIVQRQHRVQAFADPGHALHDTEVCQAGLGKLQKALGFECRIDRGHLGGDVTEALGVEDFLEGGGRLVSHGGFL